MYCCIVDLIGTCVEVYDSGEVRVCKIGGCWLSFVWEFQVKALGISKAYDIYWD